MNQNRLSAEKNFSDTPEDSEFSQSESPFEPHSNVSCYRNLAFFPDTHGDLHLLNLITGNLMQYNLLIHWFDIYFQVLSQQVSSLNFVQWLTRKCITNGKSMLKCEIHFVCNYLYTYCVWILYTNCIHNFHTFVDQNWCIQSVCKMYMKCIPHFNKLLYTFCI